MSIKRAIFEFLVQYQECWGIVPTCPETRKIFGGWCDDVDLHLEQLAREGLIRIDAAAPGTIVLPPTFAHAFQLNVQGLGLERLNQASEATVPGTIALDLRGAGVAMPQTLEALMVSDESMVDAGIRPGDIAVLTHRSPQRGDIVAVNLHGHTRLRRWVLVAGIPHFLAENAADPELTPSFDLPSSGVLWALIRTALDQSPIPPKQPSVSYSKDGPLESRSRAEFVRNLDETLTKRISARQAKKGGAIAGSKEAIKKPAAAKTQLGSGWPKAPCGIELNDQPTTSYHVGADAPILDERPDREYHAAFFAELKAFSQKHRL